MLKQDKDTSLGTRLIERTGVMLSQAWKDIAGTARVKITGDLHPDLPQQDLAEVTRRIDASLEGRGGQVAARTRAATLGQVYLGLSDSGKLRFFNILADRYGVDQYRIKVLAQEILDCTEDDLLKAEQQLREQLTPPRVRLLTKFNSLPDGVKFIVNLRADLLRFVPDHPHLKALDVELKELLVGWFDIGFLELRSIGWDAPAALLEKLIAYEAVHEIKSWDDLKNRLDSDRRCYAYFHPKMPDEPLIFVEVALVNGIADNVQHLLDEDAPRVDPHKADSAIFYSISNAQAGLAGVAFGDFLIKKVVSDLKQHFPQLKNFCTLSPVPGFRKWLSRQKGRQDELLTQAEAYEVAQMEASRIDSTEASLDFLIERLDGSDWTDDDVFCATVKPVLMRLCQHYLTQEKRRGSQALDPVAHFHLTNGARLERINWMADTSAKGIAQSAGLMVNYLYRLNDIEANHEKYRGDGIVVTTV